MTQHTFTSETKNGVPVEILTGWDRPLQRYFLVIETEHADFKESDGIVYSNLDDSSAPAKDWEYFGRIMHALGIDPPEGLVSAIGDDRVNNRGNLQKRWN